jgi:hypothetical protein
MLHLLTAAAKTKFGRAGHIAVDGCLDGGSGARLKASDGRLRECNLDTQNRTVLGRRRTSIRASNGALDLGSISKRKMERRAICRDMPKKLRGDR